MIRTTMTMLALGFLTVSGASAMAATKTSHHQVKPAIAAATEGAAPAGGEETKAAKEPKKASKPKHASKKDKAGSTEAPSAPAPEAAATK